MTQFLEKADTTKKSNPDGRQPDNYCCGHESGFTIINPFISGFIYSYRLLAAALLVASKRCSIWISSDAGCNRVDHRY